MTSLWVIVRSEHIYEGYEYESSDPTVCGVYTSKDEAIEEIIKLYIEDDIDLVVEAGEKDGKKIEAQDYRPKIQDIKKQRQSLLSDEVYNTFTNRGNIYTLVECKLGAKHEFEEDVMNMYQESL
jgi:predicted cupin superfamily sugar epimerase